MFVKETEKVLSSKDVGNDLISLTRLQQKHKVSDKAKCVQFIRFGLLLVTLFVVALVTGCLVHWTSDQAVLVVPWGPVAYKYLRLREIFCSHSLCSKGFSPMLIRINREKMYLRAMEKP